VDKYIPAVFHGSVKCEQLTQPPSVTLRSGQELNIACQVSYSIGSYHTAWVRQVAGKGLEWIGSRRHTGDYYRKNSLISKFSIELNPSSQTVTLNGQNMQPEDTAVYYCARQTQQYKPSGDLNKNGLSYSTLVPPP
uniref:Ig-like domain-containing protein n=1 Tax=Hippocampus comes TaxID=109280 RepID=A0A3Q2YMJ6_HIPCM